MTTTTIASPLSLFLGEHILHNYNSIEIQMDNAKSHQHQATVATESSSQHSRDRWGSTNSGETSSSSSESGEDDIPPPPPMDAPMPLPRRTMTPPPPSSMRRKTLCSSSSSNNMAPPVAPKRRLTPPPPPTTAITTTTTTKKDQVFLFPNEEDKKKEKQTSTAWLLARLESPTHRGPRGRIENEIHNFNSSSTSLVLQECINLTQDCCI